MLVFRFTNFWKIFLNYFFLSKMSANQRYFAKDGREFPVNIKIRQLATLPQEIPDVFDEQSTYQIKSNVKIENIPLFIDYLINKSPLPDLNMDNIVDFYNLSKEFGIIELTQKIDNEYSELLPLSFLKAVTTSEIGDISDSEKYISMHLEAYLQKYPNEMYKVPFTSLYNIFYDQNRKLEDENLGYKFISRELQSSNDNDSNNNNNGHQNDDTLFILLKSLNSSKLKEEALKDCLSKQDDHFGFIPQIDFGFIEKVSEKVSEIQNLSKKVSEIENLSKKVSETESMMVKIQESHQKLIEEHNKQQEKMKGSEMIIFGLIQREPDVGSIRISGIFLFFIKQSCISHVNSTTLNLRDISFHAKVLM